MAPARDVKAYGRMMRPLALRPLLAAALLIAGCGGSATLPVLAGIGHSPALPDPRPSLIPTVNIATAKGWGGGGHPTPAPGLQVNAFATGLDHPRWLTVLSNGDVLVAETNAPSRPDDATGLRGFFFKLFMRRAGAATPSADRVTLLRDTDGDGRADVRQVLIDHVHSPFGMAAIGDTLYVAATDALLAYPLAAGSISAGAAPQRVVELPAGTINHHWTKNVIASPDGSHLYVSVGSNSNAGENGLDAEVGRASIWEVDRATGAHRLYATGLRNPVGMAWSSTGALWVAVNERDEIGSDLVPDYMTSVQRGGFYGWPFSYYGQHVDSRVTPQRPALVRTALVPDYALGPHTASLGLASAAGNALGAVYANGMFVGQHGSWNRRPKSGYKVIFVPFRDGRAIGEPVDVLTGFLSNDRSEARGRPVGVVVDRRGALLVADDVGNTIWRVSTVR